MRSAVWAMLAFLPVAGCSAGTTGTGGNADATLFGEWVIWDPGGDPIGEGDHFRDAGADSDSHCIPDCTGRDCGPDGCGGSCGQCEPARCEGTTYMPAETCEKGWCIPPTASVECDDGDALNGLETCDPETGCVPGDSCDDGKECTQDEQDPIAGCTHSLLLGFCLIDGVCYGHGDLNPDDPCLYCRAEKAVFGQPPPNPLAWTTVTCDDGRGCTNDECIPIAGCTYQILDGFCLIDDICYGHGDLNPDDPCLYCRAEKPALGQPPPNPLAWTTVTCDGNLLCDGGRCLPRMSDVQGLSFQQGCEPLQDANCLDAERPRHRVTVPAFSIDLYEVTVSAYRACHAASVCTTPETTELCNWNVAGRDEHPVNCVTWQQAAVFCAWAGRRLCTESEWELAARGTDGRLYPWGNQVPTCDYLVFDQSGDGCGLGMTWPVGSKPAGAGPFGTQDMAGNVFEMVEDDWHATYDGAPSNGAAWVDSPRAASRIIRGGSFQKGTTFQRASGRIRVPSADREDPEVGFRCCRSR